LWGIPLILLTLSLSGAKKEQAESTAGKSAAVITVGSRDLDDRRAVTITASGGRAPTAFVDVPGTVTAVKVSPGGVLATGAEVVSVDGHPLRALLGTSPLYRALKLGDSGDDVRALGQFLVAAGLLDAGSADGSYGVRYRDAVVRFQHSAGYTEDGVFQPSYVVFLPQDFGVVTEVSLAVGQRITAQSQAMTGTAPIVSLAVRPADGGPLQRASGGNGYGLRIGSEKTVFSALPVPAQEVPQVWSAIVGGVSRGDLKTSTVESDSGTQTQVEGAQLEAGTVRAYGSVPASAVFTTKDGQSCLFVAGGKQPDQPFDAQPVSVSADSGEFGLALVDAKLIGAQVSRDPAELSAETLLRCK
jgi:peptidoglycan hydrolase-like protein with peptidoglycan-binding domain